MRVLLFTSGVWPCIGGGKMKDWDKQDDSNEELPNEGLQDVTDSDSDGGGW